MTTRRSRLTGHLNQSSGAYELVGSAVLFGGLGWWLDGLFGLTPILLVTLTMLGFVGSSISLYYRYRSEIGRLQAEAAAVREAAQ